MFSRSPDSAARSLLYAALFWLAIGSLFLLVAATKLVVPDFLSTRLLSYGRARGAGTISFVFGWLTLGGLGAIVWIVPRLTGTPLRSEIPGQVAGLIINLAVVLGVAISIFGGVQGNAFSEMPVYLDFLLVLGFVIVGGTVGRSIAKRVEPRAYVSLIYFVGALVWGPLGLVVSNAQSLPGVPGSIAHLFEVNVLLLMWLAPVGIGAAYYVVPRASGAALYSHRLALIGFWSLAFTAPLAGQARYVFGPAPDWLESVAISASIALLIPVVALGVNVFGTLRGAWDRVPDHPSIRFFVAGTVLFGLAGIQFTLQSFRSAARNLGASEWVSGQIWLLLLGAFTAWVAGVIVFSLPRLIGHRWINGTALSFAFWSSAVGAAVVWAGSIGSGLVTAAVLVAGNANKNPLSARGWDVVADGAGPFKAFGLLGWLLFTVGAWVLVTLALRTTAEGEPHPIEVVLPEVVA